MELLLDRDDGVLHPLVRRHVVGGREHRDLGEVAEHLAGERVEPRDPLDRVAPPLDPDRGLLVRGVDLEDVALDAELPAGQVRLVPQVLDVDEALLGPLHVGRHALVDPQDLALVLLGRAQAVDARDARHDQDVAAGQERGGRRVPQALDLVVDRGVLLDVGVGGRDVRLGLVVVVVRDEVLHRVLGEGLAELVRELGRERLVGRDDDRRPLDAFDHVGDRERLARPGRAEQGDVGLAGPDALDQVVDGRGLVTGRNVVGVDLERGHGTSVGAAADVPTSGRPR